VNATDHSAAASTLTHAATAGGTTHGGSPAIPRGLIIRSLRSVVPPAVAAWVSVLAAALWSVAFTYLPEELGAGLAFGLAAGLLVLLILVAADSLGPEEERSFTAWERR
jgi:hypothetical protein